MSGERQVSDLGVAVAVVAATFAVGAVCCGLPAGLFGGWVLW
jgi:ABC-type dipeptide/oligopeptide/nickel transport system permease subunit